MPQAKGVQPVEAPASHFQNRLIEAITKYQDTVDHVDLSEELLAVYQVAVTSKEYSERALSNLFHTIKETLIFNAELTRIVNHFSNPQNLPV